MSKLRHCDECTHCTMTGRGMKCAHGHKPPFVLPDSPMDDEWGWQRKCADFKPLTEAQKAVFEPKTDVRTAEEVTRQAVNAAYSLEWRRAGEGLASGRLPSGVFAGDNVILLRSE